MRLLLAALLFLTGGGLFAGEDILANAQRELRARKFYFGEIDGRASEETVAAIQKFQTARGIDHSGHLDTETIRALGLTEVQEKNAGETKILETCDDCVLKFLEAWQNGDWSQEQKFYSDKVDYFSDLQVGREFLHDVRTREIQRWPRRKYVLLNRVASLLPGRLEQAQVTARVHSEVGQQDGPLQSRTEDLLFRLEKKDDGWRIIALKLLE